MKRQEAQMFQCKRNRRQEIEILFLGPGENDQSLSFSVLLFELIFAMSKASVIFMICKVEDIV